MKKRKVCVFCESWESGGIESVLCNILQRINMNNISIDIVAETMKNSIFTETLRRKGVRFLQLSGNKLNVYRNLKLFRCLLKEQKYDVLHLNIYQALSMCYAREAEKMGVPVRILHSHNTALRKSKTRRLKMIVHNIAKTRMTVFGTHLFACSSEAARFMFSSKMIEKEEWEFIPNGIETERFEFSEEKRDAFRKKWGMQRKFVIGNIGRLCYQKNQDFLLDVFAELREKCKNSKLMLIGVGEDENELRRKVRKLELEDDVIFFGTTENPEEAMWAMDLLVFPSRFEGLSLVIVEAQASGLPVICSEALPPEAFLTKSMRRVPLADGAQVWAEAIAIVSMATYADRKQASRIVKRAGFDIEDVAKRIEECYLGELT